MGTLHVVATPIGNLEDVTLRALRQLASADLVLAEDTRRTRVLLDRHELRTRPAALHRHNDLPRLREALAGFCAGGDGAVVSAGVVECGEGRVGFPILDVYLQLVSKGGRIVPFRVDGSTWVDIGRPEQLARANELASAG